MVVVRRRRPGCSLGALALWRRGATPPSQVRLWAVVCGSEASTLRQGRLLAAVRCVLGRLICAWRGSAAGQPSREPLGRGPLRTAPAPRRHLSRRLRDGWDGVGVVGLVDLGQPFAHTVCRAAEHGGASEPVSERFGAPRKRHFWHRGTAARSLGCAGCAAAAERVLTFRQVRRGRAGRRCIIRHLLHFLLHKRDPEFGLLIVAWRAATPSREPPARRPCAVDQTPRRRRDSRH
jgi:hypothetical protein